MDGRKMNYMWYYHTHICFKAQDTNTQMDFTEADSAKIRSDFNSVNENEAKS